VRSASPTSWSYLFFSPTGYYTNLFVIGVGISSLKLLFQMFSQIHHLVYFTREEVFLSMTKRSKRRRSFKVQSDFNGNPIVKFGGKYLPKELGLECGDRLELSRDNDLIILRKYSEAELAQYETAQKEKAALALIKKLLPVGSREKQIPAMVVAESRSSTYTVEEEISRHLERYSQAQ